jgi:hypothetical protein
LFEPFDLSGLRLPNRIVMAPMTRSRATPEGLATASMAAYFAQRAAAGLIITEGIQPSLPGQSNPLTPGLHTDAQVASWWQVTDAVHVNGGRIFGQLMHGGRISHPDTTGLQPVGPSAIAARGAMVFTPTGPQPAPVPRALSTAEAAREGGTPLDHEQFRPAFAAAADLRVPLYIHPACHRSRSATPPPSGSTPGPTCCWPQAAGAGTPKPASPPCD